MIWMLSFRARAECLHRQTSRECGPVTHIRDGFQTRERTGEGPLCAFKQMRPDRACASRRHVLGQYFFSGARLSVGTVCFEQSPVLDNGAFDCEGVPASGTRAAPIPRPQFPDDRAADRSRAAQCLDYFQVKPKRLPTPEGIELPAGCAQSESLRQQNQAAFRVFASTAPQIVRSQPRKFE